MKTGCTLLSKAFLLLFVFFLFVGIQLCAQTVISGNLQGTLTKAGSPYRTTSASVAVGQTLTIEPGVEIFFSTGGSGFTIYGTLIAEGTPTDSIRFTSNPSSSPNPYDYYGPVQVMPGSPYASFAFVKFKGLGYQTAADTLVSLILSSPMCSVRNCNFENILGTAIRANVPGIQLSNNKFSTLNLDVLTSVDNVSVINGISALKVGLLTGITKNDTIRGGNSYKILNNLTVPQGVTLKVDPGAAIQFASNKSQVTVLGTLKAEGTATDSITFAGEVIGSVKRGPIILAEGSVNNSLDYVRVTNLESLTNLQVTTAWIR